MSGARLSPWRHDTAPAAVEAAPHRPRPSRRTARELTSDHPATRIAVGAVTAIAVLAVVASHRANPVLAVLLSITVLCFGVLAAIDVAEQRLPNRITLPLGAATTLAVLTGGVIRSDVKAALGALGLGLIFALIFLVMRFGMGDVKLALTVGTIAGWLGWNAVVATALVGAMAGMMAALALIIVHRRRDLAFGFGPFLVIGSIAGMLVAGP